MRRNPVLILLFDFVLSLFLAISQMVVSGRWTDSKFHAGPVSWFMLYAIYGIVPSIVYYFGLHARLFGSEPTRWQIVAKSAFSAVVVWFVLTEYIVLSTSKSLAAGIVYQLGLLPSFLVSSLVCGLVAGLLERRSKDR